ncbi:MAG TPA: nuclear transport factor 2 family protein [Bacteroidota bacterium]|nr:nuclear transport factor 2 family protein [Bacteroidota bacterium]
MTDKEIAVNFLQAAATGNVAEAFALYTSTAMVHHNPYFAAPKDVIAAAMIENQKENPDKQFEIRHVIEENGFVAVHSKVRLPAKNMVIAIVHIFKIESNKITELWDIGQQLPADSPNSAGMF